MYGGSSNPSRADVSDWRALKSPVRVSSVSASPRVHYDAIGMILYSVSEYGIRYALVKRRASYGLHKVLAANFHDKICFTEISNEERLDLLEVCDMKGDYEEIFKRLWYNSWWGKDAVCERMIQMSLERFLRKRTVIRDCILSTPTIFPNGVWGFPKGKNDKHQNEVMCAFREVREETGLSSASVTIQSDNPVVEVFKQWRYKYFIAEVDCFAAVNRSMPKDHTIDSEVSDVVWLSFNKAYNLIPAVMEEKRKLLSSLHTKLTQTS
jgi:8-oxo-dGTP pyrophosphatase MutT (NUDIX family)